MVPFFRFRWIIGAVSVAASLLVYLQSSGGPSFAVAFELIQSVPEGTHLEQPGVRHATDAWVEMIDEAQKTIDLAQFYASSEPGEALEPVMDALRRAGSRGVKIRFLISNNLLQDYRETYQRLLAIPGLESRVMNLKDLKKHTGGILHAKYWIVDGKKIFVGSQNFDWRALTQIHELGLVVTDTQAVTDLARIFESDWEIQGKHSSTKNTASREKPLLPANPVVLTASPPALNPEGVGSSEAEILALLRSARSEIRIQLLSYDTWDYDKTHWTVFDQAIRQAAARGVRVRLLLSDWNRKEARLKRLQNLSQVPGLEVRMVFIPNLPNRNIPYARVIHSKYVTVDARETILGTSNWQGDYFKKSRNVELHVRDEGLTSQLNQIHERIWTSEYAKDVLKVRPEGKKPSEP